MRRLLIVIALTAFLLSRSAAAQLRYPGTDWDHVSPAQAGWSETLLAAAQGWSSKINSTAVLVIHRGVVVAEWGDTIKRTELASVRKSLLSALIGIAVAERKISLDSTLGELGIDDNAPSLTDSEKQATVRMLLQARSGIYHPALYETPAMARRRPLRSSHEPGKFWYYNNWDFNALGTIYERATGVGIYEALDRLIARPIAMQDYRPQDGTYFDGAASTHRAYPIRMSARDLGRFGLLYLRNGAWAGRQILPVDWVRASTRPYSDSPELRLGYGYLWWTNPIPPVRGALPEGAYAALGAGGQYAIVIPAFDLVVVNRVDRDQHLPEPRFADVMQLLDMIMKAGQPGANP